MNKLAAVAVLIMAVSSCANPNRQYLRIDDIGSATTLAKPLLLQQPEVLEIVGEVQNVEVVGEGGTESVAPLLGSIHLKYPFTVRRETKYTSYRITGTRGIAMLFQEMRKSNRTWELGDWSVRPATPEELAEIAQSTPAPSSVEAGLILNSVVVPPPPEEHSTDPPATDASGSEP